MAKQVKKTKASTGLPILRSRGFPAPAINLQTEAQWRFGNSIRARGYAGFFLDRMVRHRNQMVYDPIDPSRNPFRNIEELQRIRRFIRQVIDAKEHILIYGDYDCDGVVSMTLMRDLLLACGARKSRMCMVIPDRINDGYGIKAKLLNSKIRCISKKHGRVGLIIAVDCGTNDRTEFAKSNTKGRRVIVVDHHTPDKESCPVDSEDFLTFNPKLWLDSSDPARLAAAQATDQLCAAGLVYLIAQGVTPNNQKWNRDRALLLSGFATCTDCVPLTSILNWRLLKESLRLANDPAILRLVPGLFHMARRPKSSAENPLPKELYYRIDEDCYGFDWGPTLNAPGRMKSADASLELLIEEEDKAAKHMVAECRKDNQWRQATTRSMLETARPLAETKRNRRVMVLRHPDWHPGVVGIVAARIKDEFNRPTFVCGRMPDGSWVGSGRSIAKPSKFGSATTPLYHIGDELKKAKQRKWIFKGGGHGMAGGMSFLDKKKFGIQKWLEKNAKYERDERIEALMPASLWSPAEWGEYFERLSPFGQDHACPLLLVEKAELLGIRPRTRVRGDLSEEDDGDGYKLNEARRGELPVSRLFAPPRPDLWAYEGLFRDLTNDQQFFAHWLDLQMAEYLWEVSAYVSHCFHGRASDFQWQRKFRLQFELRSYISANAWAVATPRQQPRLSYNFQIRQCVPLTDAGEMAPEWGKSAEPEQQEEEEIPY